MLRVGDINIELTGDKRRGFDVQIEASISHPNYVDPKAYYDIGIIQTKRLQFSETVRPICLPQEASFERDGYLRNSAELVRENLYYL